MLNNRTLVLFSLILLLVLPGSTALAQEVPNAAPLPFDVFGMTIIIQWAIIAFLLLMLFKQRTFVPPEVVIAIAKEIREATRQTKTLLDDGAAEILTRLVVALTSSKENLSDNEK
jgi:hypothetical protein